MHDAIDPQLLSTSSSNGIVSFLEETSPLRSALDLLSPLSLFQCSRLPRLPVAFVNTSTNKGSAVARLLPEVRCSANRNTVVSHTSVTLRLRHEEPSLAIQGSYFPIFPKGWQQWRRYRTTICSTESNQEPLSAGVVPPPCDPIDFLCNVHIPFVRWFNKELQARLIGCAAVVVNDWSLVVDDVAMRGGGHSQVLEQLLSALSDIPVLGSGFTELSAHDLNKALNLSYQRLDNQLQCAAMSRAMHHPWLSELASVCCGPSTSSLKALESAPFGRCLRKVQFASSSVPSLRTFSRGLQSCLPCLAYLDMSFTCITDADLQLVAKSFATTLETLVMSGCWGLTSLAPLRSLKNLSHLDVTHCENIVNLWSALAPCVWAGPLARSISHLAYGPIPSRFRMDSFLLLFAIKSQSQEEPSRATNSTDGSLIDALRLVDKLSMLFDPDTIECNAEYRAMFPPIPDLSEWRCPSPIVSGVRSLHLTLKDDARHMNPNVSAMAFASNAGDSPSYYRMSQGALCWLGQLKLITELFCDVCDIFADGEDSLIKLIQDLPCLTYLRIKDCDGIGYSRRRHTESTCCCCCQRRSHGMHRDHPANVLDIKFRSCFCSFGFEWLNVAPSLQWVDLSHLAAECKSWPLQHIQFHGTLRLNGRQASKQSS